MSGKLRRAAVPLTMIVSSILVAELALSLAAGISPRVRYALRPWAFPRWIEDPQLRKRGNPDLPEHDAHGFRNDSVPERATIVALGDSNTYGHRLAPEQAWPRQLSRLLDVPVYNMGIGGWDPPQYRAVLPDALGLSPETIVVCVYLGNDLLGAFNMSYNRELGRDLRDGSFRARHPDLVSLEELFGRQSEEAARPRRPLRRALDTATRASQVVALLRSLRLAVLQRSHYGPRDPQDAIRDRSWRRWRDIASHMPERYLAVEIGRVRTVLDATAAHTIGDPRPAEGRDITARILDRMSRDASRAGVRFEIVLLPTKEHVFGRLLETLPEPFDALRAWEQELLDGLVGELERRGLDPVDLTPDLVASIRRGDNPYFETDNTHISAAGQAVVAARVAARLR